jgi:hypothetical protein
LSAAVAFADQFAKTLADVCKVTNDCRNDWVIRKLLENRTSQTTLEIVEFQGEIIGVKNY